MIQSKPISNLINTCALEFEFERFDPSSEDFTVDQIHNHKKNIQNSLNDRIIKVINDKIRQAVSDTDYTCVIIDQQIHKDVLDTFRARGFCVIENTDTIVEEEPDSTNLMPKYSTKYEHTTVISWEEDNIRHIGVNENFT